MIVKPGTADFYRVKDFGGFSFSCHPTCQSPSCSGPSANQCESCAAPFSMVGSDIHASLTGRCLCASGGLNAAGTACDVTCAPNCASCHSASPTECYSCPNGVDYTITRNAQGTGECLKCHSSCKPKMCSGPEANQCIECPNTTEWSFDSGTCTEKTGGIIPCHSCLGPAENECLVCKDSNSIVLQKTAGSNAGPCVSCADPSRREAAECSTKVVTVDLSGLSISTPSKIEPVSSGIFEPMKAPVRVPNKGKHFARLVLPQIILERISQLGSSFVFTDFMSVSINGLTSPADYKFSGAVNQREQTYDVTFVFQKD